VRIETAEQLAELMGETWTFSDEQFAAVTAPLAPVVGEEVRPAVRRMLDSVNVPALVHTRRWDVIAWNQIWTRCFPDFGTRPANERNLLKILLTEADFQRDPSERPFDRCGSARPTRS